MALVLRGSTTSVFKSPHLLWKATTSIVTRNGKYHNDDTVSGKHKPMC